MGHPVWNLRTKTPQNEATTVPWHQGITLPSLSLSVSVFLSVFLYLSVSVSLSLSLSLSLSHINTRLSVIWIKIYYSQLVLIYIHRISDVGYLDNASYKVMQPTAWIPLLDANENNGCMQVNNHRCHKPRPKWTIHSLDLGGTLCGLWTVAWDKSFIQRSNISKFTHPPLPKKIFMIFKKKTEQSFLCRVPSIQF